MSLTGLLDVVVEDGGDPALRAALEAARSGARADLDLTAPPGARPFAVAALAAPRRPAGAGRHGDRPGGRGPGGRAARPAAGGRRRRVPVLGDAAARAAQPAQRHRRPPARRAAPAGPPRRRRRRAGPVQVVVAPVRSLLQPLVTGLGDLEPVALRAGDEVDLDDVVERLAAAAYARVDLVEKRGEFAVRGGILDVFPPDRGAPAARGVLGRRRRGDPLLQGRRPAVAGGRRARAVGAALPGAAADRRGARAGARRWPTQHPRAGRNARQDRRGHRGRGHGVARAGPGRRHGAAARRHAGGHHGRGLRPGAGPHPGADLVATSQEFLEASWANAAAGGSRPDRPRRGRLPQPRRRARPGAASSG